MKRRLFCAAMVTMRLAYRVHQPRWAAPGCARQVAEQCRVPSTDRLGQGRQNEIIGTWTVSSVARSALACSVSEATSIRRWTPTTFVAGKMQAVLFVVFSKSPDHMPWLKSKAKLRTDSQQPTLGGVRLSPIRSPMT